MSKTQDKPSTPKADPEDTDKKTLVVQNKSVVDYGEDVGAGFENQTREDYSIPFIDILQPGSPEVLEANRDGARAGMIINRVTGEVFEAVDDAPGILLVPALTEHCYTEWRPKKGPNGELLKGGFVGRHELTEAIVQHARTEAPFKVFRMPNGNDLAETFYVYGQQLFPDESCAPVAMAFGSTKIKSYKSWNYIAKAIQVLDPRGNRVNPPLFSHKYRVRTKMRKEGGNTWFIPVIGFAGVDAETSRLLPVDPLYLAARGTRDAYKSGALKADYTKTNADVVDAADGKAPF